MISFLKTFGFVVMVLGAGLLVGLPLVIGLAYGMNTHPWITVIAIFLLGALFMTAMIKDLV